MEYQPCLATDPYYVEGFMSEWAYDPEKAAQIPDDAGWVLNVDGVCEKDGMKLEFEISCRAAPVWTGPSRLWMPWASR